MTSIHEVKCEPIEEGTCVLVASGNMSDRYFLDLLPQLGWRPICATDWREARTILERQSAAIVIAEEHEALLGWKDFVESPRRLSPPPKLIVTSQSVDEELWPDLEKLGAFDVLMSPFDERNVARVMRLALAQWETEASKRERPADYSFARA